MLVWENSHHTWFCLSRKRVRGLPLRLEVTHWPSTPDAEYDVVIDFQGLKPWQTIVKVLKYFWRFLRQHDAFIFLYGDTLLPYNLDLPILKLLSKKTIMWFIGSDIRHYESVEAAIRKMGIKYRQSEALKQSPDKVKQQKRMLHRVERYVDYIIYSPMMSQLLTRLKYYDTGSWLKYCRSHDELASRHYMEVQVGQIKQLFAITNDSYFDSIATRWESYLQGEEENCIVTNGWYYVLPRPENLAAWSNIADWDNTETCEGYGVEELFDSNRSTYFAPARYDLSDTNPHYIYLRLKSDVIANSLVLTLYNRTLFPEVLDILYRSNQNPEWLKLNEVVAKDSDDMHITYKFDEMPISALKLVCKKATGLLQ